ncbi:DUF2889 domain-containing protein [Novosphingobium soli]|uniref:DUF2889 domain-containing protein n=1 Tax=Novosphingobium soli TaxID=574956 RepID=A0ABV6D120_9SPHN
MIACAPADAFLLPGYRRFLRVEPAGNDPAGRVLALLEDDLHAMAVELRHRDGIVTGVEAFMDRAPWTTCPGAQEALRRTFMGQPLREVTARREKQANCTHLHDLAVLAAAHASDRAPQAYEIAVSDPDAGERVLEIRGGGTALHRWVEQDGTLIEPLEIRGLSLLSLRDWISGLSGARQEAARLLQWAGLVAHSRTYSDEEKRAALFHRPSCFTMQPERAGKAVGPAPMEDFTRETPQRLDRLRTRFAVTRAGQGQEPEQREEAPASTIKGDERWK